ncbi:MAG: murein biosynthesis integral membrane protein MurJ, partial [bacterium]|nr:murein biosynthesis integral membrane protein MurJ [bacterium]
MSGQYSGAGRGGGSAGNSGNAGNSGGSLAGAFAKMFSGTLVSRILGMVRSIVLLAALGAGFGSGGDPFNVANNLPNTIYNLLAGGVMNAILVPQIVRAMRARDGGSEYLNKLITLAGTLLFVATVVFTVAAPLLVMLYASGMDPGWRAVAIAMALWCIPELFFYGLYALFGNVLNARGSFGPYMWAPVLNNVISILGLFVYIWVFGTFQSGSGRSPDDWDTARIALVAGVALLGVAAQALVLIPALRTSGVTFRLDFKFRGAGLSGASRMAKWAFAGLLVGQVGFLMLSNVANAANGAAQSLQAAGDPTYLAIPTITAYTSTFMVYMLPQSLVTTSLVTAIFTSMSAKAAAGNAIGVRNDMSRSLRILGVFSVFAGAAMTVLALPVIQTVLFTTPDSAVPGFAAVLAALAIGIPGQSIWTVVQRVSFAYEDAKTLAKIQIPMSLVIVVFGAFSLLFLPPQWWLVVTALGSSLSQYVGGVVGYASLRTKLPSLDGSRILRTYIRLLLAVIPAALAGWILLHFWGPQSGGFLGAAVKLAVLGTVMLVIYVALLKTLQVRELDEMAAPIIRLARKVSGRGGAASASSTPGRPTPSGSRGKKEEVGEPDLTPPTYPPSAPPPPPPPTMGDTGEFSLDYLADAGKDPSVQALSSGATLAGRFRLTSRTEALPTGAEVWEGRDTILDRAVTIVIAARGEDSVAGELLNSARRASLVEDTRFARLVDIGETTVDGTTWTYVVSVDPPGTPLGAYRGRLDAATASAVVGETAAALEAARRRGVQHGALTPSLVRISDDGVVLTGLAYLSVAAGTHIDSDDAVEASLSRSRADAEALGELYLELTGDSAPDSIANAVNAGAIMRALAPWGAIALPAVAGAVGAGGVAGA